LAGRVFAVLLSVKLKLCDARRVAETDIPKPTYRWPWFLAAAVALGFVLAILWVGYAVHREEAERDFSAPLPTQNH
jgi:hypothetical protein